MAEHDGKRVKKADSLDLEDEDSPNAGDASDVAAAASSQDDDVQISALLKLRRLPSH
jgi:hypothetical protein